MALLLKDMIEGVSDKVAEQVVDTFLRESEILQMLPFDNTVSPQGGSTLTYSYLQAQIPSKTVKQNSLKNLRILKSLVESSRWTVC